MKAIWIKLALVIGLVGGLGVSIGLAAGKQSRRARARQAAAAVAAPPQKPLVPTVEMITKYSPEGELILEGKPYVDPHATETGPFLVIVRLAQEPAEDDDVTENLAAAAAKIIKAQQPANPGRLATFHKMTEKNFPFDWVGWYLTVREVKPAQGGWRATVWVQSQVKTKPGLGGGGGVANHHIEEYRYQNGVLTLEKEYTDPSKTNPDELSYFMA